MATRFEQTDSLSQGIRRRATSKGLSFGPIATAITVGVVAVLLGVTLYRRLVTPTGDRSGSFTKRLSPPMATKIRKQPISATPSMRMLMLRLRLSTPTII